MSQYVRRVDRQSWHHPGLMSLDIELTERCNNDCIHCCINRPMEDTQACDREMSTVQVKVLLRQAVDLGCLQVRFTGGEPLLREDFEEIYVYARRLGLRVLIYTNARLVTPRLASLWADLPPLVPVEVSVYGMHEESYEAVSRAEGSFAEFRRGVDLLLNHRVAFVVKGALLPPNRGEMDEFETWAATVPGMEQSPGYVMWLDLRSRRDDPEKNRLIESLRISPEEGLAVLLRDEAKYRREAQDFVRRFAGLTGDRLFVCGAGSTICIDAYGAAQPCMGVRASELTVDVRAFSLAETMKRFRDLADLRAEDPEYLRRCARCSLKGFCEQCPAKSWAEHGTLDTPVEYLCDVAHVQAWYLGVLKVDEFGWGGLT